MIVVLYIIGILVYLVLPLPLQIVCLIFNTFIPDSIPYIDEIIMYTSAIRKCIRYIEIYEWIMEHKVLSVVIGIGIVIAIIILIKII